MARSRDTLVAMIIPSTQILGFQLPFFNKRNQSSLEKWMIPEPEQEKVQVVPGIFLVPESKKVLFKKMGTCQKDTGANSKELPVINAETI